MIPGTSLVRRAHLTMRELETGTGLGFGNRCSNEAGALLGYKYSTAVPCQPLSRFCQ